MGIEQDAPTLADVWLKRLKNNPVIAATIVLGVVVIAASQFWNSLPQTVKDYMTSAPEKLWTLGRQPEPAQSPSSVTIRATPQGPSDAERRAYQAVSEADDEVRKANDAVRMLERLFAAGGAKDQRVEQGVANAKAAADKAEALLANFEVDSSENPSPPEQAAKARLEQDAGDAKASADRARAIADRVRNGSFTSYADYLHDAVTEADDAARKAREAANAVETLAAGGINDSQRVEQAVANAKAADDRAEALLANFGVDSSENPSPLEQAAKARLEQDAGDAKASADRAQAIADRIRNGGFPSPAHHRHSAS